MTRAGQRPVRPDRARPRVPHHGAAHGHAAHGAAAPDPAGRRLDRLRRQPAPRLRHRQRRGRHRPRVPPRRRPAPGALAQLGPGRRADGAPRGAALAVARHALPRQPAARPPRPGHRLLARGGGLRRRLDRHPPQPPRLHGAAGDRDRRGPQQRLALPRRRPQHRVRCSRRWPSSRPCSSPGSTPAGWPRAATAGSPSPSSAASRPRTCPCCAGCATTPARRWRSRSTSTRWASPAAAPGGATPPVLAQQGWRTVPLGPRDRLDVVWQGLGRSGKQATAVGGLPTTPAQESAR